MKSGLYVKETDSFKGGRKREQTGLFGGRGISNLYKMFRGGNYYF